MKKIISFQIDSDLLTRLDNCSRSHYLTAKPGGILTISDTGIPRVPRPGIRHDTPQSFTVLSRRLALSRTERGVGSRGPMNSTGVIRLLCMACASA